jgi:nucleotide-binding universal stress UspA family protein
MPQRKSFNSLLVPVDFSDASREAFRWALDHVDHDDATIIVLHVIDERLADVIAVHGFAEREEAVHRLRAYAVRQLADFTSSDAHVQVDTLISVGQPFVEIIRKADDFAVDAIVMSKVGRSGQVEKLLFGSTAEKVLRGSHQSVIAVTGSNVPNSKLAVEC